MRSVFCILFTVLSLTVFAQGKHLIYPVGWKGNRIELHTISDKTKQQSCTFIARTDSIRALIYNREVQIAQQFSIPRDLGEELLGGFIRDGKVFLFIENDRYNKLHNWVLDLASGSTTSRNIYFDLQDQKIIDRINCGDHFVIFTARKKTKEFVIHDFRNDSGFTKTRHAFGDDLWSDITKPGGIARRDLDIGKVDAVGESSIDNAACRNKLYSRNDTLYLLMNRFTGETQVYSLDLINQKVATRSIMHPGLVVERNGQPNATSENTYLLGNNLYYVQASSDSLCLQVMDFHSGRPVKTWFAGEEGSIPFKNTAIFLEDEGSGGYLRDLKKTKQLLRKMVNGKALIMATNESTGRVQLSIGSYSHSSGGGGSVGGMWMRSGAPGSSMHFIPSGGVARNDWSRTARFKTLLHAQTAAHIEGKPLNTINEMIAYYTSGMKIPPEGENLFENSGAYYFAYWDTRGRRLVLLKFKV